MRWIDLFEAIFLAGMYEDFKARAERDGKPFTMSKGLFVRKLGESLDLQLAHQDNGRPPRRRIEIVSS